LSSGREKYHEGWVVLYNKGNPVPYLTSTWSDYPPKYFKTKEEAEAVCQALRFGGWAAKGGVCQ
jgi:hypothetical protein